MLIDDGLVVADVDLDRTRRRRDGVDPMLSTPSEAGDEAVRRCHESDTSQSHDSSDCRGTMTIAIVTVL